MSKATVIYGLLLLLCFRPVSAPQDYTVRLDSLLEKVKSDLAEKKPEWKHRSIEPIQGSRNVSVNNWEADGQIVRVSICALGSSESAAEAMRSFSSETRTLERLPELGDGGYSWGLGGSNICFRKGDVTVWVSSGVTNLKQAIKLSQEFAKLIDAAILPAS
jgi:hypothetical protein